jgi:hypothetical protein
MRLILIGMKSRGWLAVFLFLVLTGTVLYAQRGRQLGGQFGDLGRFFGRASLDQNDPPQTEFILARWHYGTGRYARDGWSHDYPTAEEHILQIMKETSLISVDKMSYRIVELSSPEIFKYPFSYVSEPGEMLLTDQEIENLRQYIDRGGFVMIDDFGGQGGGDREFQAFRSNLLRAYPDRDLFVLPNDHPLLHIFYDIDSLNTVHPMTGVKSIFYGYPDGRGGLSMVVCYNNDVGDFWEFIDEPLYPVKPSAEALKLGLNFVIYAMTH